PRARTRSSKWTRACGSRSTRARWPLSVDVGGPRQGPQTPNLRSAPGNPGRSSVYMGAPTGPPNPQRSERPGKPGALLCLHGGPDRAPKPPAFGAPRETRGAPLSEHGGPDMAPTPPTFGAPREPGALLC